MTSQVATVSSSDDLACAEIQGAAQEVDLVEQEVLRDDFLWSHV